MSLFEADTYREPIVADAVISDCGKYRYRLTRTWDAALRPACFVMLNPSTADSSKDDPTIRKCVGFAKLWGCGGIVVVNLFAWRATDPADMKLAGRQAQGVENDWHIREAVIACDPVVCAWGTNGSFLDRDLAVKELIRLAGLPWGKCLGKTKDGHPKHPLYMPYATELVQF